MHELGRPSGRHSVHATRGVLRLGTQHEPNGLHRSGAGWGLCELRVRDRKLFMWGPDILRKRDRERWSERE